MTHNKHRAAVLAALPGNCNHVAEVTGFGRTTIWRWLTDLHTNGEAHVDSWSRSDSGGPFIPCYTPGSGVDAICKIKPMSEAQKARRHRKKAKRDGSWEDRLAKQRAKYWANKAKTRRDPLVAALFGMAA